MTLTKDYIYWREGLTNWEDGIVKRTVYTGRIDCTYWEDDTNKRTVRTGKKDVRTGRMALRKGPYVLGG